MCGVIKIVSVRELNPNDPNIFYVGRRVRKWHGSALGNPYRQGRDGDRRQVIEKYRQWLWSEIKRKGPAYWELRRIVEMYKKDNAILLGCWCYPNPCHADVIKRAAEYLANLDKERR